MESAGEEALQLLREPKVERLSELRVLKLLNLGLAELPPAVWGCQELRQLDVGGNPLLLGHALVMKKCSGAACRALKWPI